MANSLVHINIFYTFIKRHTEWARASLMPSAKEKEHLKFCCNKFSIKFYLGPFTKFEYVFNVNK